MVSVHGWLDGGFGEPYNFAGDTSLVVPSFWIGNPDAAELAGLRVFEPRSPAARFTQSVLRANDASLDAWTVHDGRRDPFAAPSPERVYLIRTGSRAATFVQDAAPEKDSDV